MAREKILRFCCRDCPDCFTYEESVPKKVPGAFLKFGGRYCRGGKKTREFKRRDGECKLSEEYLKQLHQEQADCRFTVTGVLLDKGNPDMSFSLEAFCQDIYRTSQLLGDDIVRGLVSKRV